MVTLCDKVLDSIKKKFDYQVWLNFYESRLEDIADSPEKIPIDEIKEEFEQKRAEIRNLEEEIYELAALILRAPLCLVPIAQSHRPFLSRLEMAIVKLEALEKARSMREEDDIKMRDSSTSEAWNDIQYALGLLNLDPNIKQTDQALVWLFLADVYGKRGDYELAQKWAKSAFEYLTEMAEPQRMVARLIQGNIYSSNVSTRKYEAKNAYYDAVRRLERLEKAEAERGNRHRTELYRVLKQQLLQKLGEPRKWKI